MVKLPSDVNVRDPPEGPGLGEGVGSVGLVAGAGLRSSDFERLSPPVAPVMRRLVCDDTARVVTVKVSVDDPAGTVIDAGTEAV